MFPVIHCPTTTMVYFFSRYMLAEDWHWLCSVSMYLLILRFRPETNYLGHIVLITGKKERYLAKIQIRPLSFQTFTHNNRKALKLATFSLALPHSHKYKISLTQVWA